MFKHLIAALKILGMEPTGVKIDPRLYKLYDFESVDFILDAEHRYRHTPIGRFAYNTGTGELVFGPMMELHATMIQKWATSPFDDFVRGTYSGGKVMLRWYAPNPYADPEEIKTESFNQWWDTKQMLEKNGLPPGTKVEMGYTTEDLRDEIGGWYR